MNRNTQERFALNPVNIDIQRSRFLMTPEVKTSFNVSDLVPVGQPIEVLPGDTFEISTAAAVRMQPLVSSPMDNLSFDYYWFFVPNRIVWDHWKEFMGENTDSAWIPQTEYTIPQVKLFEGAIPYSVADYMGIPTGESNQLEDTNKFLSVSALPFRAYALIYQEFFRNQNIIAPPIIYTDDADQNGLVPVDGGYSDPLISATLGGSLFKVSKRPDYFTKALPGPQKGPDLTIMDHMPVYFQTGNYSTESFEKYGLQEARVWDTNNNGTPASSYVDWKVGSNSTNKTAVQPANWYVDGNLSISALRTAFQIQKLYEKDARGGTRYREMLKAHFGVTSPDASQQVPQYLGGKNIPININSVIQTSETGSTPQGNVAGYSLTSFGSKGHDFIQSFTEHGYLICLGCARVDQHSYQQGIHRSWSRRTRTQFYFPVLSSISDQPIYNKEIYAKGFSSSSTVDNPDSTDNEVFGYQEAWAEYRYMPSLITGQMRSASQRSLDVWHFGDDYSALPSLSQEWIQEDRANVDRVLQVQSSQANQLFGDFRFNIKATRPMPMYSIPGLVDHH